MQHKVGLINSLILALNLLKRRDDDLIVGDEEEALLKLNISLQESIAAT